MKRGKIKTSSGKTIDMDSIRQKHENSIALTGKGDGEKRNARGDILGKNNKVIKTIEEIDKEYQKQRKFKSDDRVSLTSDEKLKKVSSDNSSLKNKENDVNEIYNEEKEKALKTAEIIQKETEIKASKQEPIDNLGKDDSNDKNKNDDTDKDVKNNNTDDEIHKNTDTKNDNNDENNLNDSDTSYENKDKKKATSNKKRKTITDEE